VSKPGFSRTLSDADHDEVRMTDVAPLGSSRDVRAWEAGTTTEHHHDWSWETCRCGAVRRTASLDRDALEQLLAEHRYSSADDMTDASCACGEWPKKWTRSGYPTPIPDWIEHVTDAAFRAFAEVK
jgi:hypothetical protein